jgi:2-hydroxy-3-oxopropionate reductase
MICVPDTPDVEAVLFGPHGVATQARRELVVIDTSTISPTATREFAARLREKGTHYIDCPVSGGPKGAIDGTLSCMIGGDAEVVAACQPLLAAIGNKHVHLGAAGAGQLVKACNQLAIAATLAGVSEAIALARSADVDPYKMRDVLLGGSAQSFVLQNHAKRLLDGTLAPGFRSRLMLKDLKLGLAAGRDGGVFMPTATLAAQLFTALCNDERADLDSAALGLLIQELSGQESS